jgi:hypothetical protein
MKMSDLEFGDNNHVTYDGKTMKTGKFVKKYIEPTLKEKLKEDDTLKFTDDKVEYKGKIMKIGRFISKNLPSDIKMSELEFIDDKVEYKGKTMKTARFITRYIKPTLK